MTEQRNIVFLDIDGVLNTSENAIKRLEAYKRGEGERRDEFGQLFCPRACLNLEYLCDVTGAVVVVSSVWRRMGLERFRTMFEMRNINVHVLDVTPDFRGAKDRVLRGEEIAAWLAENQVDNYVILDDDTDFLPEQMPHFVHCDNEDGFNWRCMVKAIKILVNNPTNP